MKAASANLTKALCLAAIGIGVGLGTAQAGPVTVKVTVENLTPANGIAFAPLRLGFNQGVFDAFNTGTTATAPIISVAEGGSGNAWFPAFAAAEPGATTGTVGGLLLAGASASSTFTVDAMLNPFFTFGAMVVPSNDFFIGNDSPTQYRLFDANGQLQLTSITQTADDVWDAGSEIFDPAAAAFVGNNGLRTPQNGVVNFNFSELAGFDGLPTGAGYTFVSGLRAGQEIYRISFEVVPAPATLALAALALGGVVVTSRRRPRELRDTSAQLRNVISL
jgi:hypothetical protein